jgi:membrane-associated phospholipid phosphatase
MSPWVLALALSALCVVLMALEWMGFSRTATLPLKGDVKRETRFLAQYGQLVCTFFTALLIWQLDKQRGIAICYALWTAVIGATAIGTFLKRVLGRVRPRRESAGKFLGPSLRHANYRESFPSSHSASAMAYSAVLSAAYPHGAITFWTLGLICAGLRYILDAHWPSDVVAGIMLGYVAGFVSWRLFF